jgi:hypothetical protein
MMFVDFGSLTEANFREAFVRYSLFNAAGGYVNDLTVEDFERHIGLHVNVANKTLFQYLGRIREMVKRHVRDMEYKAGLEAEYQAAIKH